MIVATPSIAAPRLHSSQKLNVRVESRPLTRVGVTRGRVEEQVFVPNQSVGANVHSFGKEQASLLLFAYCVGYEL